jgi:hypothetical protein
MGGRDLTRSQLLEMLTKWLAIELALRWRADGKFTYPYQDHFDGCSPWFILGNSKTQGQAPGHFEVLEIHCPQIEAEPLFSQRIGARVRAGLRV